MSHKSFYSCISGINKVDCHVYGGFQVCNGISGTPRTERGMTAFLVGCQSFTVQNIGATLQFEQKVLAVIFTVETVQNYLLSRKFVISSDEKSLTTAFQKRMSTARYQCGWPLWPNKSSNYRAKLEKTLSRIICRVGSQKIRKGEQCREIKNDCFWARAKSHKIFQPELLRYKLMLDTELR